MTVTRRKALRIQGFDYRFFGWYFVTICTFARRPWLSAIQGGAPVLSAAGTIVSRCWESTPSHFPHVALDAFVVMPNHVHGLLFFDESGWTPERRSPVSGGALGTVVRSFKAAATREIRALGLGAGPMWQANYYEHVVRNDEALHGVRSYVANNPAQWELDRENPDRRGVDPFEAWLEEQGNLAIPRPM